MNKIEKVKEVLAFAFLAIFFGGFLVVSILGNIWRTRFVDECTEEVVGYVSNNYVEDYLYAPYHGGIVEERHRVHVTYSFDVDDIRCSIHMQHPDYAEYPDTMVFKYNPDNPTEFIYDVSEWYGEDEPDWRLSTATLK